MTVVKMLAYFVRHLEEIVIGLSMIVMIVINFGNVLCRYVINFSFGFTEELCVMLFILVSFMGAAMAARYRNHLGFDMLLEKFPPKMRKAVETATLVLTLALMGIMFYYGLSRCRNLYRYKSVSASMRIPEWIPGLIIPAGSIAIGIRTIQAYLEKYRRDKTR
ncbi:MAG: TRAP transporter small permease [Synergistaceae bacterium]|jgi:C4-dicarboxylate transporter DctQ subunit|nr:TRAP transporter small permease [Synergistaceae bacterium]